MKKLLLWSFGTILLATVSLAQNFEGKISYKISVKGENAALLSMMMPKSTDLFISGDNSLFRTNGGMAPSADVLTLGGKTYMVMHKKKTAYLLDNKEKPTKETLDSLKPTVKSEGTETVNGYSCTKYLVKFPKSDKGELYQYMWCTTDIKVTPPKAKGSSAQYFVEGIEGFPVKIDQFITASMQGTTMTINQEMTLDGISEAKPDATLFQIPSKYKIEDFDEAKLLQGL